MSRKSRVRTHNKGRELNFLENIFFDFSSQRLGCLVLAVFFFYVPNAKPEQWWIYPIQSMFSDLDAPLRYSTYIGGVFLFFAVFGGKILKSYFGIETARIKKQQPNIVKQTVVRDARGGTIKGIISRLPVHLQKLISKR